MSFVDSYGKFTWLYLLKHKSDVTKTFMLFQAQVEHQLAHKIINF